MYKIHMKCLSRNSQLCPNLRFSRNVTPHNPKVKLDLAFNNVKPKEWYFVLD